MARKLTCLRPPLLPTAASGWAPDASRGSRQARGYGSAWDRLRARILARDAGLCQPCLDRTIVTTATQVDHIVPKAQGGSDDEANLQAICPECHRAKTARESQG